MQVYKINAVENIENYLLGAWVHGEYENVPNATIGFISNKDIDNNKIEITFFMPIFDKDISNFKGFELISSSLSSEELKQKIDFVMEVQPSFKSNLYDLLRKS